MQKDLVYQSVRIRKIEEKIIELYPTDLIQSPVHLSIGQEAVAVGMSACLREQDKVFINYRGHAFYLARGGDLKSFFCELMGRGNGVCKGKGGSMHLADPKVGIMGASAVVGSTISHAIGSALANKIKKENAVFVSNFGDGATEQGALHECLNLAALYEVPVLFLCEDNGLAVHSRKQERQTYDLEKLVSAYGIEFIDCKSGYDAEALFKLGTLAVEKIRETSKPIFMRVHTCRYLEHVGPNEDLHYGYRSADELVDWKNLDPCFEFEKSNSGLMKKIDTEINEAVEFALNSELTHFSELLTDI